MKPATETSETLFLDRILSKKKVEQTGVLPVPVPPTSSIQEVGLCANIFLQPNVNNKIHHQQPFLFPRTLSTARTSKTQLSLYQLSHLRPSPFPSPLGQGKYYQNLVCLKKKAKLSSLIHLAQVFKGICNVDTRTHDKNKGGSLRKKRRLMKGLFKNNTTLRKKQMNIVKMKDVTNLPKERQLSQIGSTVQDEIPVFDYDLAALTISRENPVSVKIERYAKHPPYLEIKIPQRSVLLTAMWDPYEVKPSGIVGESKNLRRNGIATLLALGEL